MLKHCLLALLLLTIPTSALANSIISWEAFGAITSSTYTLNPDAERPPDYPHLKPPVGTPYAMQLRIDMDTLRRTTGAAASAPCNTIDVTGSLNLGGFDYGLAGWVFTNSALPGSTCSPGLAPLGFTEFFMFPRDAEPGAWDLTSGPRFLNPFYVDGKNTDGSFSTTPVPGTLYFQNDFFIFRAPFSATAIDDPEVMTPVPEPGTLSLLGVGLVYGARRHWRSRAG